MNKSPLLVCAFLICTATAAWAYRPLQGLVLPSAADTPVLVQGVTSSLQDDANGPNTIWDTTVVMRNASAKQVTGLELELTMADLQGYVITRITCPLAVPLASQAEHRQRVREVYLAWPGTVTAAIVKTVVFTDGSRWPVPDKPPVVAPAPLPPSAVTFQAIAPPPPAPQPPAPQPQPVAFQAGPCR